MTPPRNPVGWFEIYVTDMARAKAFYETVLIALITDTEGNMIGLHSMK